MERRAFVLTSLAATFGTRLSGEAQQSGKVHRIGWLWGVRPTEELLKGLREGLQVHGWVEGQNFVFLHRAAEGHANRQAELVAELVQLQVALLVTSQSIAVKAAMAANPTLPIVMLGTGDPVAYGLVQSLARPGGQVTGLGLLVNEVSVKLLGLLRKARPETSHVAVFVNAANPGAVSHVAEVRAAALRLGMRSSAVEVRQPEDLGKTVAAYLYASLLAPLLFAPIFIVYLLLLHSLWPSPEPVLENVTFYLPYVLGVGFAYVALVHALRLGLWRWGCFNDQSGH